MDEFGLMWVSTFWYRLDWFGVVEFEFVVVRFPLVGLEVDLNENAIVETWIKIIKVT